MSLPQFSRQLTDAIDEYERLAELWDKTRAAPNARWKELRNVGEQVRWARSCLVFAIRAEFRDPQRPPLTAVQCLAWYDRLANDRRPLIFAEDK